MLKTKMIIGLFLIVGAFSSCKKDSYDAEKQAKIDDELIVDFMAKNSIVAIKHSSGLYYQTLTPATAGENNFNASTNVTVNYEGKLLNGNKFDSGTNVSFPLGNLIQGWQIGIPLVKKGGRIRLLVPSSLAYKNRSPGAGIPENSVLDFTIDLISAQ